jgi:DUF2892 family protein
MRLPSIPDAGTTAPGETLQRTLRKGVAMSKNMGLVDRGIRLLLVTPAAIVLAFVIGAGSVGGIVLFVVAGIMLATSSTGYCPTYTLIGISTDPRAHRVERSHLHLGRHPHGGHA